MTALDLTAGGKLSVPPMVSEASVIEMARLVDDAKRGGYDGERARTNLSESLSTSDAPFSFAHLVNLRNLPLVEDEEPSFDPITNDESVPDFREVTFYNLKTNFDGLQHGKDTDGQLVAPRVPEGDTYQYAFGYTQESAGFALEKRGFKTGVTLEQAVNDPFNLVARFPDDMLTVGRKTDEYVRVRALLNGLSPTSQVGADEDFITGETVVANSKLTPAALRVAIRQIGKRADSNGVKVRIPAGFYLVVGNGVKESAEWAIGLATGAIQVQDGLVTYRMPSTPADPLGRIRGIIETEFIDDDSWYLVPEKGSTDRPALIRVRLAGWETPEVYVSDFNGIPAGGAASSSPFRAFHFDNDSVDFKFRQIVNAGIFSEDAVVWSDGSES